MKYAILETSKDDYENVEFHFTPYETQEDIKAAIKERRFNPREFKVLEYQEIPVQVETIVTLKRPGATRSS